MPPIAVTSWYNIAPIVPGLIPDGLASAPPGTAQFPNLFTSASGGPSFPGLTSITNAPYAFRPPQTVPGVDFPVGIKCNATASGNTITETGVTQAPTNGDKKTFYLQMGPGWPGSGLIGNLTIGQAYFVVGVSGNTYQVSTSSGGGAITLGSMPAQFIVLKDPQNTANKPSGTTFPSGNFAAPSIDITGNNATLDHWDFSLGGGCIFSNASASNFSNFVYSNNYWKGSAARGLPAYNNQGDGGSFNNSTWQYNVVDGDGVLIPGTTTAPTSTSSNVLTFGTVPAGVQVGMFASSGTLIQQGLASLCNLNNGVVTVTAINSPGAGQVTLSANPSSTINNGDLVLFGLITHFSGSFADTFPNVWDIGTVMIQYNWFKNSFGSVFQLQANGLGSAYTGAITEQFNLWDNNVWGAQVTGQHGENVQLWTGVAGQNYSAVICHNSLCLQTQKYATVDTSHWSFNAGGSPSNVTNYGSITFSNYTLIAVNGVADFAGNVGNVNAMCQVNPTKIQNTLTLTGNYIDPTTISFGQASHWTWIYSGVGGANGPYSLTPTKVQSGNINMVDGTTFGNPAGWGT